MGQQQLLLLVLSTVIVGLATVAGIQAFSENQAQASQDALTSKAVSVATDIKSLQSKPSQLGGVDLATSTDASTLADKLGLSGQTFDAPGAGANAQCKVTTSSGSASVSCAGSDANNDVQVTYTSSSDDVSTSYGDYSSTVTPKNSGDGDSEG